MHKIKTFSGNNESEIWKQIAADLGSTEIFDYHAQINQGGHQTILIIDIDWGGGFEGGFELTIFSARLTSSSDYKFAIHNEEFIDEIGKFFGMQDVELGYPEFDRKVVVKTNNDERTRMLFSSQAVRSFIIGLGTDFNMGITGSAHDRKLELAIEKGITDVETLQKIYGIFYDLLIQIDEPV
ncbi:hypothetical protein [Haloferula sp.]|uniref:hypothetical protein n=1 Tax=Haloferula sp. TaxID=2497595 RepID=UPI003C73BEF0